MSVPSPPLSKCTFQAASLLLLGSLWPDLYPERAHSTAKRSQGGSRNTRTMHRHGASAPSVSVDTWQDEFSSLGDRHDQPPLTLPSISSPRRIVLVRHGQSTWNAEGRMQGSSDLSVLTEKGKRQAQATAEYVRPHYIFPLLSQISTSHTLSTHLIKPRVLDTRNNPTKLLDLETGVTYSRLGSGGPVIRSIHRL